MEEKSEDRKNFKLFVDKQTGRQTCSQAERKTDSLTGIYAGRQIVKQTS